MTRIKILVILPDTGKGNKNICVKYTWLHFRRFMKVIVFTGWWWAGACVGGAALLCAAGALARPHLRRRAAAAAAANPVSCQFCFLSKTS